MFRNLTVKGWQWSESRLEYKQRRRKFTESYSWLYSSRS